jgi:hypothetical protein
MVGVLDAAAVGAAMQVTMRRAQLHLQRRHPTATARQPKSTAKLLIRTHKAQMHTCTQHREGGECLGSSGIGGLRPPHAQQDPRRLLPNLHPIRVKNVIARKAICIVGHKRLRQSDQPPSHSLIIACHKQGKRGRM